MKTLSFRSGNRQAGFSLVDVMVGMVLGLIGTIIIFQVFEASERVKRTTTSGGDAQQNGVAALFALERGVRQAGYGINSSDALASPVPVPLAIPVSGVAATPDSIAITYRPSNNADCPTTTPNCAWEYGPFAATTNLVFVQPPPLTTLNYCVIADTNGKAVLVTRKDIACTASAAGADTNDVILVDGIVQFKTVPLVNPTSGSLVAMQMAIVARNSQPEKPDPTTNACNTTTTYPGWTGGTLDLSGKLGLAVADDWRCYRYKTFIVTVPLRNVIWKP